MRDGENPETEDLTTKGKGPLSDDGLSIAAVLEAGKF
jgi:hypothetical protein